MPDDSLPDNEIEIDIAPRPSEEIGARLIILAALIRRTYLEEAKHDDEPTNEHFDLRHWLHEERLYPRMTPDERRLLDAPLGTADPDAVADATLAAEELVIIGWAAGLVERAPSFAALADPAALMDRLPRPWDPVAPFVRELMIRSDEHLETERERAELWLWRVRVEPERTSGDDETRAEFTAAIADAAAEAAAIGLVPASPDYDLLLNGQPFHALTEAVREVVALAAERRLHALNWLCGFGRDWSHVPLDI